ncbi:MAG: class I SAM-dependent methyltransferase [Hyphomicrobiaceae bacterium]
MHAALALPFVLAFTQPSTAETPAGAARTLPSLQSIIDGDHRGASDQARDRYRNPRETLAFFGLKHDTVVVEIWPGGGWYTDIIAPFVRARGRYYAAGRNRDAKDMRVQEAIARYDEKLARRPELFDKVVVTELSQTKTAIAPEGSADLVLTFRNVHNWMKFGFEAAMFRAMFNALKPGGILGVVEHRANPDDFPDPQALSGYVQEEQVKQMAQRAGFEFVDSSEINANPRDGRRHPEGVWTLPPSLRLKDRDRQKYLEIGESDRMTLKFRKP